MTPQEFEWQQERIELAYLGGSATADDYRKSMMALGFSEQLANVYLAELDKRKSPGGDKP